MPKILTTDLKPETLGAMAKLWVYNALDAATTYEVRDAIRSTPSFDNSARSTYAFSLALQSPVLEMMQRGMKVDHLRRAEMIEEFRRIERQVQHRLDIMARVIWDKDLNPRSPKQVTDFFYGAMGLPKQTKKDKQSGEHKLTADREALEKLSNYFQAQPFISAILLIREVRKLCSTLESEMDKDGRMRTSFNIAGTETGRFSSSSSAFDTGTNLQNQTEKLRRAYIADKGYKLGVFDLKTGESFAVGLRCKILGLGTRYLEACSNGDLHTATSKLVWPDLPWTGVPKTDREVADTIFYRHFSYRDMSKRGGHATNYYGTPWTVAKHLKVDRKLIEVFQEKYLGIAFPEIREWHQWTAGEIQSTATLTTLMGRRRVFFGRLRSDETLREAIAHDPQSSIADYTNTWLLRVQRNVRAAQLLLQGHDALVVQFRAEDEREVVERVLFEASQVRLGGDHPDSIVIPVEAKTGWNWGKVDPKKKLHKDGNPYGLADWSGRDTRLLPLGGLG